MCSYEMLWIIENKQFLLNGLRYVKNNDNSHNNHNPKAYLYLINNNEVTDKNETKYDDVGTGHENN